MPLLSSSRFASTHFRSLTTLTSRLSRRASRWRATLVLLGLVTACGLLSTPALTSTAMAQDGPQSVWDVGKQGAFVMASCRDAQGRIWFGTEDKGIWRYDPNAATGQDWRQFTTKDGLGDNNGYAIDIDGQGRVWVGHQNHGVSVFNGRAWRNYDVLEGPLGERVFDIAVSPLDGDVWIGTSRGLARYDVVTNGWSYQGRWTGLPSDQIQTLAFANDGTLFVGTQCNGLAIASAKAKGKDAGNYTSWRVLTGPGWMPLYATGDGLPCDLINDILVATDGTVYVATNYGLARSENNGKSWIYLRGKDWKEKLKGLTFPPQIPPQPEIDVLREDYVTTIAEDSDGMIWLGHPTKGVELRTQGGDFSIGGGVVEAVDEERERQRLEKAQQQLDALAAGEADAETEKRMQAGESPFKAILRAAQSRSQSERVDYVYSIIPVEGAPPLICGAGSGVVQLGSSVAASMPRRTKRQRQALEAAAKAATQIAPLPNPAGAPSLLQLRDWQIRIAGLKTEWNTVDAAYVGDDWKTQGDWMGRYGMRYAYLCAMQAPFSHYVINDPNYRVEARLGPHPYVAGKTYAEQGLRHWVHRRRWDDPRVLWNPLIGYRRQADIDDNGEVYPFSYEGPDMWVGARIPAGVHKVGLYFFNKDGHDGNNRVRDYIVDVKKGSEDLVEAENFPTLARARVRDFWGGVYKEFLLRGPGDYYFVVRKNNSFNTVMQAVLIDKVSGPATGDGGRRDIWLGGVRYEAPKLKVVREIQKAALREVAGLEPLPMATPIPQGSPSTPAVLPVVGVPTALAPQRVLTRQQLDDSAYLDAAIGLWNTVEAAYPNVGSDELSMYGRILAYRAAQNVVTRSRISNRGLNRSFSQPSLSQAPLPSNQNRANENRTVVETGSVPNGFAPNSLMARAMAPRTNFGNPKTQNGIIENPGEELLRAWRWKLPLWLKTPELDERAEFETAMKLGWQSYATYNPVGAKSPR